MPESVELLLKRGASPNQLQKGGISPLMVAAMADRGTTAIVRLLLAHGADPNYKTIEDKTAWSLALKYGNLEVAEILRAAMGK